MSRPQNPLVRVSSSQHALRVPRKAIAALAAFVARREGVKLAETDIAVVDARQIAALNRRYLRHAGPTDVISFDLGSPGGPVEAQIIVCADVAVREARRRGLAPTRELLLYVVHGLLHVMGYDDQTLEAAAVMAERQELLLQEFLHRGDRKERREDRK
ncbi:MAG: rRNA maturation RNase YbeY [Planctomycetaceae bacterium]|nr:rRNA maturation RNase YbeY [Planctomycetaceae bacterium]